MKLLLYVSKSPNKTINKVLENELEVEFNFKDIADTGSPVIKLKLGKEVLNYNYVHIPELGRYYFVNNVEMFPYGIASLELKTDVLETYRDDILNSTGTATRGKFANEYYDGGDYRAEVRQEHKLYHSDKEIEYEENTILVTIGG